MRIAVARRRSHAVASGPARYDRATRVVGTVGHDDFESFHDLVAEIAEEYGLEANVKLRAGSYAVRFSHD